MDVPTTVGLKRFRFPPPYHLHALHLSPRSDHYYNLGQISCVDGVLGSTYY